MTDPTMTFDPFLPTYRRLPISIRRAEGMVIEDESGREYLDFLGGIGVNVLGHSDAEVTEAVIEQFGRYAHVSNYFDQKPQRSFLESLFRFGDFRQGFLANSGTEATDGALKLARIFGSRTGRTDIVALDGGFHGRGFGALSMSSKQLYTDEIGPFLPGFKTIGFNNAEALESTVGSRTAAVVLETIQGEGGVRPVTQEFAESLALLHAKHEFLLIADDVQAGCGRTGSFYSFDDTPLSPDIVTMAKGIGGGLPLGAFVVSERCSGLLSPGRHGTTFGGNPVSCAAGTVVLNRLDDVMLDRVGEVGRLLVDGFRVLADEYPDLIRDIRGRGCMVGVEWTVPAADVVSRLLSVHGIIANATADTVLRLLPPYIVSDAQIAALLDASREVAEAIRGSDNYPK